MCSSYPEYRTVSAVYRILYTNALHLLCQYHCSKFFGRGLGKPFCKKVSPIINYLLFIPLFLADLADVDDQQEDKDGEEDDA